MRILAISAHPDDETLGCGGTLLRHRDRGDDLHWAIVTGTDSACERSQRAAAQVDQVAAAYRMRTVQRLGFEAAHVQDGPEQKLIESLRDAIARVRPSRVYLVHGGDAHSDHRATFLATMACLKPMYSDRHGVTEIYSYEVMSSTEQASMPVLPSFAPNAYVDITACMDEKVEVFRHYESEQHEYPLPRCEQAIRAWATVRGTTVGVAYAEAFMKLRELDL